MSQQKETSLKAVFQSLVVEKMAVLQGVVLISNPIEIQVVNDEKLIIGKDIMYIPKHLTDYEQAVEITDLNFKGTMKFHNSLKTGDKVHILSFNYGKQYLILDRVSDE